MFLHAVATVSRCAIVACGSAPPCPACPTHTWQTDNASPCPTSPPAEPKPAPPKALSDAPVWNQAPRAQSVELIGFTERGYAVFSVQDDAIGGHLLARHPDEDPVIILTDDNERRALKKLARKAGAITRGSSQRRADGLNIFAVDEVDGIAAYVGCGQASQRYLAVSIQDDELALTPRAIAWAPDGNRVVWVYRVTRDGAKAADRFGGFEVDDKRLKSLGECPSRAIDM